MKKLLLIVGLAGWLAIVAAFWFGFDDNSGTSVAGRVDRFVEQVNANTCDEPSGFDIDATTWADACRAAVADLYPGTTLSKPETTLGSGSILVTSRYLSVNDVPADLQFDFVVDGVFVSDSNAVLGRIASVSRATISRGAGYPDQTVDGPVDPEGQALTEEAHRLLTHGRCADLAALMTPVAVFGQGNFDDCQLAAVMLSPDSPYYGRWASFDYKANYLTYSWGLNRQASADTDAELTLHTVTRTATVDPGEDTLAGIPWYRITAVLYEDQWYVLSAEVVSGTFGFTF